MPAFSRDGVRREWIRGILLNHHGAESADRKMARGLRPFPGMVFIRNVTTNLEKYSFDYEMLEVFYAVDGTKTVVQVAAELGKTVDEVKPAFSRLSRQKLILSAPPGITALAAQQPPNDHDAPVRQDPAPMRQQSTEEGPVVPASTGKGHGPEPEDPPGEAGLSQAGEDRERLFMDIEYLDDLIAQVGNDLEDVPVGETLEIELRTESDDSGIDEPVPGTLRTFGWGGDPEVGRPEESWDEPGRTVADLFSYSRPADSVQGGKIFDAFAAAERSGESKGAASWGGPTGFEPKGDEEDSGGQEGVSPLNARGIEHFEKGLAALRSKLYKEALVQFELAGELDPGNRLCKANIQRIKAILEAGADGS
jgi:hypothetical protein